MERVQIRNIVLINIMLLKPLQRNNNCVSLAIWMMWVNRKWASKLDYGAYHMLIQCIINNHKKMKHRYVDLNFKVIEFYFNVYSFLKSFWNLMYVNGIYITNLIILIDILRETVNYHIISKDIIWSPIQDSNSTKFGILVVKRL